MPGVAIVTSSVPLVALLPVQVPDAVQLVALVEDQVKVTTESNKTDEDDEERLAVGLGSGAGALPPPPPPPHEIINRAVKAITDKFLNIIFQVKG